MCACLLPSLRWGTAGADGEFVCQGAAYYVTVGRGCKDRVMALLQTAVNEGESAPP